MNTRPARPPTRQWRNCTLNARAARWRMLHRLTYLAAAAIILHYLWLVKSWTAEPLAYAAITVLLLGYRLLPKQRPAHARAGRATGRRAA